MIIYTDYHGRNTGPYSRFMLFNRLQNIQRIGGVRYQYHGTAGNQTYIKIGIFSVNMIQRYGSQSFNIIKRAVRAYGHSSLHCHSQNIGVT